MKRQISVGRGLQQQEGNTEKNLSRSEGRTRG